jgi:HlyD family secretion protein
LKRWIWVIALGLVVAAGIAMSLRTQPVPVESAKVRQSPLRVTVEEEGKTRLRSRYIISAPVAGVIRRPSWKAGDAIAAGALVTQIEAPRAMALDVRSSETARARVKAAEAALAASESRVRTIEEQVRMARVDLDYWRREREREEKLVRSGDLPASRLDRTNTEVRRAEAAVATAEKQVAAARAETAAARAEIGVAQTVLRPAGAGGEMIHVTAPSGGRVIKVLRESEGFVNAGESLLEVGNANALEVAVELLSADAVRAKPGMRVILTRWGGEKPLEARVRVIEPGGFTKVSALGVEEQRVRVVADITSPETEWKQLGDGYRVEAAFVMWEGDRVLQVPANALFRTGDDWSAYVIENGLAQLRKVKPGHRAALAVEVLEGLKEGEEVVLHPDETVASGKPVSSKQN